MMDTLLGFLIGTLAGFIAALTLLFAYSRGQQQEVPPPADDVKLNGKPKRRRSMWD